MIIKQSNSVSSTATIPGLYLPWRIVLVCKEKVTKTICSGSHTASSQPSPECTEQHHRKSLPWVFQASADLWVMGRELATAMVSPALCGGISSLWQVVLSHTPCAGTRQPLSNSLALTITHQLCGISSPFRLFPKSWVCGTSSPPETCWKFSFGERSPTAAPAQVLLSYFTAAVQAPQQL